MKSSLTPLNLYRGPLFICLLLCNSIFGNNISDTLHVIKYTITVDSINYPAKTIKAQTTVKLQAKQNGINSIPLSLLQLSVDAITSAGISMPYTYNDTTLRVQLSAPLNINDTISLHITYHGQPKQDASQWGGFYFTGNYAFNMGVGFASNPHNLGKVWFPCIDEFTDKAQYEFFITTPPGYKAFCNGTLSNQILNPNGTITWQWEFNQTMPTYLASIAVAPYYTLKRTSNGIPVEWACMPADTNNILVTFQNLDSILSSFITAYGTYPFDKAGFISIPFSSGAMEHASSIHIGSGFLNGTLDYETLWAHELSHMWWGDKVTCETAGDMWLNEGFASFNEAFITEKMYGKTAYKNWLRKNHRKVLQFAHYDDGSYLSFLNVPANYTYGTTVYNKGADAVHTLRHYMGDSLFFAGCKHYLNQHAYGNANSYQLRDDLTNSSGLNMNRFFDDWIFTPGFPHFSIDSVVYYPGGLDHYFVYVRQQGRGNNHLYSMPLEINFKDGISDTTVTVKMDSASQVFHIPLLMVAQMITLDRDDKMSDAVTDYEKTITTPGIYSFPETNASLDVQTPGGGPSLVRIEHHWITPDGFKQPHPGIRLSNYHYYKVDGILDAGFRSKASFNYNGSNGSTNGKIDNTLITTIEDSLLIFYRPTVADDWQLVNGYTLMKGSSSTDKVGYFVVDTLKKGEYVYGIYDHLATATLTHTSPFVNYFSVSPNPGKDTFNISFHAFIKNAILRITDETGLLIKEEKLSTDQTTYQWNAQSQKSGVYFISLLINGESVQSLKVILNR